MPNPHASVNYVEPNLTPFNSMSGDMKYDRIPDLEDYSIYLNIGVEVCSRKNISNDNKITKEVIIMEYRASKNDDKGVVNFMGGTRMETQDKDSNGVNYLTSNYADMYVDDLIDYGTTEMIGIKSLDIEYKKACVPIINIKFTDVRGLSLFQPTELNRSNSYFGIGGLSSDNIAQSFFQCFFMVPPPRFTMTIKGFYGKPVTYEVLCDKFETSFNSETGDFDVDTRFIGYTYSFMTDIVIDALLAAPYSDYGGRDESDTYNNYWQQQIESGRFTIPNKEKTKMDNMPTLLEIYNTVKSIMSTKSGVTNAIDDEELNHKNEISKLALIKESFDEWYETLYNECVNKFGKEYCYLFKSTGYYYRLLILTTNNTDSSANTLSSVYDTFSDKFKSLNQDLNTTISEFNTSKDKFMTLSGVSSDFSAYKIFSLFNAITLMYDGTLKFNGFSSTCNLPREEVYAKLNSENKNLFELIYNDGTNQYLNCYVVNVDYSMIVNRINSLQLDANKSSEEKEMERKRKAINEEMFKRLNWYPSVSNFSKIMIAHLETFMKQLYDCVNKCGDRRASQLGVDANGNLDMKSIDKDPQIPPFPRVYKSKMGDDRLVTNEDIWVGEFTDGIGFEEVNFINGLLNGASKVNNEYKSSAQQYGEASRELRGSYNGETFMTHPLSSFDLYTNKPVYDFAGDISDGVPNGYVLAGKIAIRMFNILAVNYFKKELGDLFDNNIGRIGAIEADNFFDTTRITNKKLMEMISNHTFNSASVIDIITNKSSDHPWGNEPLFKPGDDLVFNRYYVDKLKEKFYIFPIQDISFEKLDETLKMVSQEGKLTNSNGSISLTKIPSNIVDKYVNEDDSFGYGSTLILDNRSIIEDKINSANTYPSDNYYQIYSAIQSATSYDEQFAMTFIHTNNEDGKASSVTTKIPTDGIRSMRPITESDDVAKVKVINNKGEEDIIDLINTTSYNFSSLTITEIFGIHKNSFNLDKSNSFYSCALKKFREGKCMLYLGLGVGGYKFEAEVMLLAEALICIELNNSAIVDYLRNPHTVTYVPRIVALQIGALIFVTGGIHGPTNKSRVLNTQVGLWNYAKSLSKMAKHQYEKYFIDWITAHKAYTKEIFDESNYLKTDDNSSRMILNQNKPFVKEFTNELLHVVCIVRLSQMYDNTNDNYRLSIGNVRSYLDGFLERLAELYNSYTNNNNSAENSIIKTSKEPSIVNVEMKKELYRYIKQIYDKWVPMSSFDDWTIESFFNTSSGETEGHKFYFIDSYYNDIGHKLLINPLVISEKIGILLSTPDINSMMLGFMADMFSANKAMFLTIQNFFDLKQPGSMDEMFKPIPYVDLSMNKVNRYPSFVVVYPYQPSKNLDVTNGEYKNDGFMLNDENETPIAIRTKLNNEDGHYRIPAFGVAYGKQYQSYFKRVNVNMQSPIATEQAIRMKHSIILGHATAGKMGIKSQDMYDIYASNSYTCTVEMMGCAWVQPLMYFVLLNVPMFRGSYLVLSVKHSMRPGDMTTTFTGCRMSNVSNTLVSEIFTDDMIDSADIQYYESEKKEELAAKVDNDCPYKVYNLKDTAKKMTEAELKKGVELMGKLSEDFPPIAAAGIVGNMFQESRFNYKACNKDNNGYFVGGLFQWNDKYCNLTRMCDGDSNNYGQPGGTRKFKTLDEVRNELNSTTQSEDYQIDFMKKTLKPSAREALSVSTSPSDSAKKFNDAYEIGSSENNRMNYAEQVYAFYQSQSSDKVVDSSFDNTKEKLLYNRFFEVVNKSAKETPSIGLELVSGITDNNYLEIKQANGRCDKMCNVLDLILNSEYYNYVKELKSVYSNGGLNVDSSPTAIYCLLSNTVEPNNKSVVVEVNTEKQVREIPTGDGSSNSLLLKSLAKRRKKLNNDKYFKSEVKQIKDISALDKYMCNDCASQTRNDGWTGSLKGYNGNVKKGSDLYIILDVEHDGLALDYLNSDKLKNNYKLLRESVSGSAAYRGCCTSGPSTWYGRVKRFQGKGKSLLWWNNKDVTDSDHNTTGKNFKDRGFILVWHGGLKDAEKLSNSLFCPGDIATFHVYNGKKSTSHGVMWTGKDWRSDCIQNSLSCYKTNGKDRDGKYSVCIWRHEGLIREGLDVDNVDDLLKEVS